jgi:hypothetical protein
VRGSPITAVRVSCVEGDSRAVVKTGKSLHEKNLPSQQVFLLMGKSQRVLQAVLGNGFMTRTQTATNIARK